jgi:hypothetical protein
MESKLRTIQKRLIGRILLRALAIGASVMILLMIVCMIVDWSLMLFDPAVRMTLTTGTLLAAAIACLWVAYRPLLKAFGWTDAARRVDEETPLLEERWTTLMTFSESEVHQVDATTRAMLQHVTSEAVTIGEIVEPKAVTRAISPRKALLSLAGCLLLCAGFLATNWAQTSILLRRFWNPMANITATQLESIGGNLAIPRGETVDLTAKLSGLPRDEALLTVKYESGINEVFPLEADPETPHQFQHSLRVNESFQYQLAAGDGRTVWHQVTAIDYPLLEEISFRVIPPSYLERTVYEKTWIPSRVKVAQGSRLELLMKPDILLERFAVKLTHQPQEGEPVEETLALQPGRNGAYLFELPLLDNLSIEPMLRSQHGLTNENRHVCRIEVIPDMAPIARIITPNDETAVADDDVVKVEFEAHDDHGIEEAELVIYDESTREDGKEPEILDVRPIDLKEQAHQKHVMAETELDLTELDLEPDRQISLAVRVTDNRSLTSEEREQIASLAQDLKTAIAQQSAAESSKLSPKMSRQPGDTEKTAAGQEQMIATANQKSDDDPNREDQALVAKNDSSEKTNPDAGKVDSPAGKPSDQQSTTAAVDNDAPGDSDKKPEGKQTDSTQSADEVVEQSGDEKQPAETPEGVAKVTDDKPEGEDPDKVNRAEKVAGQGKDDTKQDDSNPSEEKPTGLAKSTDDNPEDPEGEKSDTEPPGDVAASSENEDAEPSEKDASAGNKPSEEPAVASSDKAADPNADTRTASDNEPMPDTGNESEKDEEAVASNSTSASGDPSAPQETKSSQKSMVESVPLDKVLALSPQASDMGQNVESNRRKLNITKRLAAATDKVDEPQPKSKIRDRVVALDKQLAVVETGLQRILKRDIPDADRQQQFQLLDEELLSIEEAIAGLRTDTRDTEYAFVGLQMVDIGRFHVTPARDRVFAAMQTPVGSDSNTSKSLHHIERARELLAALLKQYDEIVKEKKLEDSLEETFTMYEVYVDKRHKLLRETRQNKHPLSRKMGIIEVDQAYLDRRAEVETLRREMLAEFARMLADDPRLASRYLDLIKRRRASLLEQLSELTERQEDLTTELSGWLAVDESQRKDLWSLIVDMRLQSADQLASDAAEISEQMVKTLPLSLDADRGTASAALRFVQDAAQIAREISFETRNLYGGSDQPSLKKLSQRSAQLLARLQQTERALDRLSFENDGTDANGDVNEVVEYASARLVELQAVTDRANDWSQTLQHILKQEYPPIASGDQQRLGIATELLRVSLLSMEDELQGQFQRAAGNTDEPVSVPQEVRELIYELHRVMEGITLNQAAATWSLSVPDLTDAELQQYKALEGFQKAEDLFEQIRRTVVKYLDEYEVEDPTIAQLEDPTLDEFLEDLEREPNIAVQLGIPNRPRNLRVIADSMQWQRQGADYLNQSLNAARQRMRDAMKKRQQEKQTAGTKPEDPQDEKPDPETDVKDLEEMIRRSVAKLEEKMKNEEMTEAERKQMEALAENMKRYLKKSADQPNAQQLWRKIAESDQAEAMLKAMARGEAIPDQQWNKILSTLNEGLWQIRGRTPPEEFRKSIEQYQEQIRTLIDAGPTQTEPSSEIPAEQNSR